MKIEIRPILIRFVPIFIVVIILAVPDIHAQRDDTTARTTRISPVVAAVSITLPSVVNISTERIVNRRFAKSRQGDPFAELINRFFARQQRLYKTTSLGSGVIVDTEGLILTNNHVIQRASKIIVTLADGTDYVAKPIATDEANDLALIMLEELDSLTPLVPIEFAAPDDLYLGETVITVGNPYGLGHSVAAGVLSAKGRRFIYDDNVLFEDIIQTDTAINPGNSGGPLINTDGQLIGINLAIHDEAEGIGFAIPLKRIEQVLSQWLVPARFGMNSLGVIPGTRISGDGGLHAVVQRVVDASPAQTAGILAGDTILSVNGIEVFQAVDVSRMLWRLQAGDNVDLVLKAGGAVTIEVARITGADEAETAKRQLKVEFQQLTDRLADALGLPYSRGLVVSAVEAAGVLGRRGVQRGDVLIQVGEAPIADFTDLYRALSGIQQGEVVAFVVDRINSVGGHIILHRHIVDIPF